jgi:hypothetical protein
MMPGCGHSAAFSLWGSDIAFSWQSVEMTARVHPFVQHTDDLDHAVSSDAIVENVNRSADFRGSSRTSCVPSMETAEVRTKFWSLPCERPFGLSRDLSHRGGKNGGVPLPALDAPPLGGACRQDVGQIDLRGTS